MSIYPTLRYNDAKAAIAFLTSAFGLMQEEIISNEDGTVAHAELSWEGGVVMLGTRPDPLVISIPAGRCCTSPSTTSTPITLTRWPPAAEIVRGLVDQDYGSREYASVDPEGNVWSFGTYRPTVST